MITPFKVIASGLIGANIYWWLRNDFRLSRFRRTLPWRVLLLVFVIAAIALPIIAGQVGHFEPPYLTAMPLLWDVLMLPLFCALALIIDLRALIKWTRRRSQPTPMPASPINLSRRRFLSTLAVAAPPILSGGLAGVSIAQIGDFRVRTIDLPVDGWPSQLNGFTIAHVSDVHVGPFSTEKMLRDIVDRTNSIHNGGPADLMLYGGDLINTSLRDLPQALEMATSLKSRYGNFYCQGNHDVMDDPVKFNAGLYEAGLRLLLDDFAMIEPLPGVRLQILAARWQLGDELTNRSVEITAAQRDPTAFPITMIHHPHGWDRAAELGLPVILSGHTHGGQIMLTENIGAGPLKFRYWTGIHRKPGSTLVINNGAGNWFPLRINAPAEILKLTLYNRA